MTEPIPEWDSVFRLITKREINGGPKATPADELTYQGELHGQTIFVISRVRLNSPTESFHTSSGHRLRDGKTGDAGHFVDLKVLGEVSDAGLQLILAMATARDHRRVVVGRGRHPPARPGHRGGT